MNARLVELAKLFFKLGSTLFGGPAVHISVMETEVVQRRKWMTEEEFLDLIGATSLIPGPNSTEMAMHVGYRRAGFSGLVVAGSAFILPAAVITIAFAWAYVTFTRYPQVGPFIEGVAPAVLVIVLMALVRLGRKAFRSWQLVIIGLAVVVAALSGLGEIRVLFIGSLLGVVWLRMTSYTHGAAGAAAVALMGITNVGATTSAPHIGKLAIYSMAATSPSAVSLWQLGLFFLKVGAILYGSGYVLIAYVQGELVTDLGWLTQTQLLDAIAIGQLTPGPILSTATFIGYVTMAESSPGVGGILGAGVATVAIFLPSFVFVALIGPFVSRIRQNVWTSTFLDAVNAASIGLMAAVTIRLCYQSVGDWRHVLIFLTAGLAVWRWKPSPLWIILGGSIGGRILSLIG